MVNKSSSLVISGVILAKLAEYEPINSKYNWWVIIVTYLIMLVIENIILVIIEKVKNNESTEN